MVLYDRELNLVIVMSFRFWSIVYTQPHKLCTYYFKCYLIKINETLITKLLCKIYFG
jgi:hypothetical protein